MVSELIRELLSLQQWQHHTAIALAIVSISILLVLKRSWYKYNSSLRLPPCPWRLPIIGNLHQISALPHQSLWSLAQQHGSVMLLRLGTVPTVVLSSPEAARLKMHDADCCSRPAAAGLRLLSYGYKDVVFSPYSEYVREMRKVFLVELLSMRRVQAARYAREAQVEKLVNTLTRIGPNPVALNEHIFATVDGIIGAFAFGDTYASDQFKGRFVDVINEAMALLSSFAAEDLFPNAAGRFVDRFTGLVSCREKIFKKLDDFFELVIDQYLDPTRIKTDDSRSHLVQELIDLWRQHGSTNYISKDHVKALRKPC